MNAVDRFRYRKNIALFTEVLFKHSDLPVGHIEVNLDFLASTVAGDEDMREDAECALPKQPYFVVATILSQHSSKAQLLAELLTLEHSDG